MNLVTLGRVLRRSWWWVVLILLVAFVGGWLATSATPKTYAAETRVLYSLDAGGSIQSQLQATSLASQRAAIDAELVPTEIILAPVVAEIGDPDLTVQVVSAATTATATSTVLVVTVTLIDPDEAAAVANGIVEQLNVRAASDPVVLDPTNVEAPTYNYTLTTLVPAIPPTTPASPSLVVNLLIAFAVGVFASAIFLAVQAGRDRRVYDLARVRTLTDAPVLGTVAVTRGSKGAPLQRDVAALRAALLSRSSGAATWLITSAGAGIPAKRIGAPLAAAFAATGEETLLLSTEADASDSALGLTDYLAGTAKPAEIVEAASIENLALVGAGTRTDVSHDLFASTTTPSLLWSLTDGTRVVIITAPATDETADAATLARLGGRTLVVVTAGKTTDDDLTRTLESLTEAGAEVGGVIWVTKA
ncbi:Wzz/FepE/Etk N-terminal domain-containing protein [Microbacterium sp. SS28]|uniref:Wzz/FepE/Etk N-terminal domain-containing protein n=1 Tax=Microbacterium sp. SS28 TaxID=2919948 RepID=UPI001FAA65D2|nr:Wzz/FepE/Etk N-terminal domain-containing protein [Microbacterium sp. SS28]